MATPSSPQVIIIDENGDLTLHLYDPNTKGDTFISTRGSKIGGRVLATMKVSRQVLINNSRPFKVELTNERWAESHQTIVDMEVDDVASVEIAMRVLHKALSDTVYTASITQVWELVQYCNYRELDTELFESWFAAWLAKKNLKEMKPVEMLELLTPSYTFNHARAWAFFTKGVVYGVAGNIMEKNPTDYHHLHLDGNALGALKGAKGSLHNKLMRGLCDPLGEFKDFGCSCKERSVFNYVAALTNTGLWPLHESHNKAVREILDSPGLIKWDCQLPADACGLCRSKTSKHRAEKTRLDILGNFDGLCLDCMTKTKTGDVDRDYWEVDLKKAWSVDCRFNHGQATWYFSFMGRKTDMVKYQKKKKLHFAQHGNYNTFFR